MLTHLLELRRRSLYTLVFFAFFFLIFFCFSNELILLLINPLLHILPNHSALIATHIMSPLIAPLKLATDAALLLSAPIALYHMWRFAKPGLHSQEQRLIKGAILFSMLLFFTGIIFCFYLVLPFMFQCSTHALPKEIRFMPDMAYVLDFITRMMMLFGFCFQIPLIILILIRLKIITITTLKTIRPYVIVGAFIIGMLLTPPDVFSQIMLAVPLCLLYELGIILALCLN